MLQTQQPDEACIPWVFYPDGLISAKFLCCTVEFCHDIIIVNLRYLKRPQKRSRRNQLIHKHLSKTKSIGMGSRSGDLLRQTVRWLWWMMFGVEMGGR